MDEKTCKIHRAKIDSEMEVMVHRLNRHSDRIDNIEKDIVAQKKDTTHLEKAIKSLQSSIDALIEVVDSLKNKPLEKYEKVAMVVVTSIVSYLVGRLL